MGKLPKMPSFHTSLRYSFLGTGILIIFLIEIYTENEILSDVRLRSKRSLMKAASSYARRRVIGNAASSIMWSSEKLLNV